MHSRDTTLNCVIYIYRLYAGTVSLKSEYFIPKSAPSPPSEPDEPAELDFAGAAAAVVLGGATHVLSLTLVHWIQEH